MNTANYENKFTYGLLALMFALMSMLSIDAVANDYLVKDQFEANLVIYRANDYSAINYRFLVDGQHIGKLKRGASIYLKLEPGQHTITASDSKKTNTLVMLAEQGVTQLRVEIDKHALITMQEDNGSDSLLAVE